MIPMDNPCPAWVRLEINEAMEGRISEWPAPATAA